MAEKLTPQQALAVNDRGGKLLVSAAAGSGKTKVLVDRLMKYLTDPVDPANLDEFLIITYTKAAASELRGKIAQKLTEKIAEDPANTHLQRQMQRLFLTKISTVHGFCSDILKEYAYRLDIPSDFRVADETEIREIREAVLTQILDEAYETAGEDPDFRAFVDSQGLGRDDRLVPDIIQKVYDSAMCHLHPKGWLERCMAAARAENVTDASETIWGSFLMEDLINYLDQQLNVMRQCAQWLAAEPGMEKAFANIKQTLEQLESLRGCVTWDDIIQNKEIDFGRLNFPRKNVDQELVDQVKAIRGACKKGLEKKLSIFSDPSRQILDDLERTEPGTRGLIKLVERFDEAFRKTKKGKRILDFGDLEHRTLDLLLGTSRGNLSSVATEIGGRFREVMVDEYQDSNGVQDAIFEALTRKRQNCFMVGDVKQSIYQFRLADPGIFLKKYHDYADAEEAEPGQGRKVLLSHNFRSGPEVIEGVNCVFGRCMSPQVGGLYYTEEEALREGVPHTALGEPGVEFYALEIREDTYSEEAAFVAEQIEKMLHSGTLIRNKEGLAPVQPEDIVILLRSPNSVGVHYQRALEDRGIRCNSGGGGDLLQTEEIATMRSLLQTIMNPRQDIPLISALASPLFGFTADDLATFRSRQKRGCVYEALKQWDHPKAVAFCTALDKLRRAASMKSVSELLQMCYALTGADNVYAAMPGGENRQENLRTFYKLAADYEAGNSRDLGQFLDHLESLSERGLVSAAGSPGGSVTIMSIHKSKGLEVPVVFLCALARDFNRDSLRAQILCDQQLGLGLSVADSRRRIRYPSLAKRAISVKMAEMALSEEMRVLYVAMTRARDRLVMVYSPKNLESSLQNIALRRNADKGALLCADASCPGDWVALTAMGRLEAGQLFQIGGHTGGAEISDFPWKIEVVQAPEGKLGKTVTYEAGGGIPERALARVRDSLTFKYPYMGAVSAPSKQTATGRKGREKDEEAAENTPQQRMSPEVWRKPTFISEGRRGKEYGNAVHTVMQYLLFECCGTLEGIDAEIRRLVECRLLLPEQEPLVSREKIFAFFCTPIGRKLASGATCIREFKFSILDDASGYGEGLQGEKVLLQGVVDCALLDDDGITVIDFKTDRATEQTVSELVRRYSVQVNTYCEALSRIYGMPVKNAYIYFFSLDRFESV